MLRSPFLALLPRLLLFRDPPNLRTKFYRVYISDLKSLSHPVDVGPNGMVQRIMKYGGAPTVPLLMVPG